MEPTPTQLRYIKRSARRAARDVLALYSIDQLADAMRGHETDVFSSLEYLSEDEDEIRDYRERILNRVRQ